LGQPFIGTSATQALANKKKGRNRSCDL